MRVRRANRRSRLLAAAMVLLAIVAGPDPAWARSFWIEDFSAKVVVNADGSVDVTEEIRFRFDGSYNGIYRDIPIRYRDNLGFSYALRLAIVAVSDDTGNALRYETSRQSGGLRRVQVWVPGAQDTSRTVRLLYRVERALRFFPEHDELYWNVTGTAWGVPIEAASVDVVLPAGIPDRPRTTAYVGRYGSRGDAWRATHPSPGAVRVEATEQLAFGEGLTVVVGWPKGVVAEPTLAQRGGWLLADNWPLSVPFFVLLLMSALWSRFGRDPQTGRSVMPIYGPPEDLTPAEIGTLVDERVDQRDIVATVVDLAVRGYLRIEESTEKGWFVDSTTTTFHRLKPADAALRSHERSVLDGIFEKGETVTLDDLENSFHKRLEKIRRDIYRALVRRGYFRASPQTVRRTWLVIGVIVLAVGLPAAAVLDNMAALVGGIASGLIILAFSWFMPARTRAGAHKLIEVKGFEEFLGRTEGDRLRAMEVDVTKFERFLPFAMALGVAEQWGRAFEGLLDKPPTWYVGAHGQSFSPSHFTHRMSSVSKNVGTAMASAPRSSSGSSGFSGGGFSGGGFGGGGGGAF